MKRSELEMSRYQVEDKLSELKRRTGYNIAQENGQRKTGPPPFWTGPPPPRGCEVFIGKLPRDVFEDELFPLFQTAGVIYEFRMMMDFSCSNRGYAFVTYTTREEAQRAVMMLNNYEIRRGHRIGVLVSVDNRRLYIFGLPANVSDAEVYAELAKYTSGLSKVSVFAYPEHKTRNRKYALVEYASHRHACMARKVLIPNNVKLFDCEITVDWAPPEPEVRDQIVPNINNGSTLNGISHSLVLHVRNIPDHIGEGLLMYLFSLEGHVAVSRVKKLRDFAFVHYHTRNDAQIALSKLNGFNLGGWNIEVSWARSSYFTHKYETPNNNSIQSRPFSPSSIDSGYHPQQQPEKVLLQNNPIKILSYLCSVNGWGSPVYDVIHTSYSDDDDKTTFTAKITISNLPYPVKCFSLPQAFLSPGEAKNYIADYVLRNIVCLFNDQITARPVLGNHHALIPGNNMLDEGCVLSSNPMPSIWNTPDVQSPPNYDFLDQDNFLSILASAASLANVQLQKKEKTKDNTLLDFCVPKISNFSENF